MTELLDELTGDDEPAPPTDVEFQAWANAVFADTEGQNMAIGDGQHSLRSHLVTAEQLRDIPPPLPLIDGLLDLDSLAVLFGPPKQYKSFTALDWACSITAGLRWQARAVTAGPVLYVAAEGVAGLWPRVEAWRADRTPLSFAPPPGLHFITVPVQLTALHIVAELADIATELGANMIVLDTLARCALGLDENSAKDMGLLVESADMLRRRTGACVLIVHHSGKATGADVRGSSALRGAADTVMRCEATDGVVELTVESQKNHAEANPIRLVAIPVGDSIVLQPWHPSSDSGDLGSNALAALDALRTACIGTIDGVTATVWRIASGIPERTFYRIKGQLIDLKYVAVTHDGRGAKHQPVGSDDGSNPTGGDQP